MSAIYPGSFDPVTNGHIDIARRGAAIMGRLIVAVLDNPHKTPLFTVQERVDLLRKIFLEDSNIEVEAFSGLLVDYAKKKNIQAIIRGLRGSDDLAKEMPYGIWNRQLSAEEVETIYLTAAPELAHISGSIVKEVAVYDVMAIAPMVPPVVLNALNDKLR